MKRSLYLIAGILSLSLLSATAADEATYPAKSPVIKYVVPAAWTSEVDPKDGSISINSDDGKISVNFAEVPVEATMEMFKGMVPEMVKELKDAKEADAAKEQTSDGLTGYTSTYAGTVEGSPAVMIMILFKAGKDRSILGDIVMVDPATMPKEQGEKFEGFMKSLKGVEK